MLIQSNTLFKIKKGISLNKYKNTDLLIIVLFICKLLIDTQKLLIMNSLIGKSMLDILIILNNLIFLYINFIQIII